MQSVEDSTGGIRQHNKRKLFAILGSILVIVILLSGGVVIWIHLRNRQPSPVPATMAQDVSFPIYYPVQEELPSGYTLDVSSFNQPIQNGVNYIVSDGQNEKLTFSLQLKPSATELQNFTASYIPLHNTYQTQTGQASIGAYNTKHGTETLVSLPASNSNTWIIVTGPYNINQSQLKQVLSSLRKN